MKKCKFFLKMNESREALNRAFSAFCLSEYKKAITESVFGFLRAKEKDLNYQKLLNNNVRTDYNFDCPLFSVLSNLEIKVDADLNEFYFEMKQNSMIQNIPGPLLFKSLLYSYKYPGQAAAFQKGEIHFAMAFHTYREKFYRAKLKKQTSL